VSEKNSINWEYSVPLEQKSFALSLGVFRVLFTLVFLWTLVFIYSAIDYEITAINPSLLKVLVVLEMLLAVFILFGYKYNLLRYIYVPLGLSVQFLLFKNQFPIFAIFFVNSFILMQHLFLPLNSALSVDKLLSVKSMKVTTVKNFNFFFPLFLMGLVYFDGGVNKLFDAEWGSQILYFFQLEYTSSVAQHLINLDDNFITNFFIAHPLLNGSLLYVTVVYQLFFIGVIFLDFEIKKWFFLIGVFLHIGIIVLFGFWIVSFAVLSLYTLGVPSRNFYRLFIRMRKALQQKRRKITVFYDLSCPVCSRYIFLLKIFDFLNHIKLIGRDLSEEKDIIVYIDAECYRGVEGFRILFKHIVYFKPLYLLLSLSVIKKIADTLYSKFASMRTTVSCPLPKELYAENYNDYKIFVLINILFAILLRFLPSTLLVPVRNFTQLSGIAPSLTIFLAGKNPSYVPAFFLRVKGEEILPYDRKPTPSGHIIYLKTVELAYKGALPLYSEDDRKKFRYIHNLEDINDRDIEVCAKAYRFNYKSGNVVELRREKDKRVLESVVIKCKPLL